MPRVRAAAATAAVICAGLLVGGCGSVVTSQQASQQATSSAATQVPAAPADAQTFEDPAGRYRISVDPDWTAGTIETPRFWYLSSKQRAFNDNINVVVESGVAGVTPDEYLQLSIENAPRLVKGFALHSSDHVALTSGAPATRIVYSGAVSGSANLRFLAISTLAGEHAVTVTLTAPQSRFDADVAAAEPYLRTVEALP